MGRKYRTKFPMARIKKIMQLDNEIGKVALATPILISKALEVFMQNLVDSACEFTVKKGTTKLEPNHLKRCIHETEQFDFLKDVVASVEANEKNAQVKEESEDEQQPVVSVVPKEKLPVGGHANQNSKLAISSLVNDSEASSDL